MKILALTLTLGFYLTSTLLFSQEESIFTKENTKVEAINPDVSINSSEISLFASYDHSVLVYSTKSDDKKAGNVIKYISFDEKTMKWSNPISIEKDFNLIGLELSKKITIAKQKFLLTNYSSDAKNIYTISYQNNKWTEPEKVDVKTKSKEADACLSPDGNTLYYVSDCDGGYGGKDIYACEKRSDGSWTKPYNVGKEVNTPEDEESPFLLADGTTLYFSSKGHNSKGGYDVFSATLDDYGLWQQITNLGTPINSEKDERYFIFCSDEKHAFYSSSRDNK